MEENPRIGGSVDVRVNWTEEARDRCTIEDVALALGWEVWSKGGARGFLCPEHPDRHSDGRPTGRIVRGGAAWYCHRGGHGGDAISLVSHALFGASVVRGEQFHAVRDWFAARGWCTPWQAGQKRRPIPAPARPVVRKPAPALSRAASSEVEALWSACYKVGLPDTPAGKWLAARELHGPDIGWMDLARGISAGIQAPAWAGFGEGERFRAWGDAGWGLALPCYDARGEMVAIRARWTGTRDRDLGPVDPEVCATYHDFGDVWEETPPPFAGKEVSPRGAGFCRGSVYADPVGRWLLSSLGQGQIDPDAPDLRWSGTVIIIEGGPAFLHYATQRGRVKLRDGLGYTPAVFGVWSGAWPDDDTGRALARRCKVARRVIVACDDDEGGDRIGRPIIRALQAVGCTPMVQDWQEVSRG